MKLLKSLIFCSTIAFGVNTVMAQTDPPAFSPDVFARYTEKNPFTVSKAFNHMLSDFQNYSQNYQQHFSAKDLLILNNEINGKNAVTIQTIKQQAAIFKTACKQIENDKMATPETKADAMITAYELSESTSAESLLSRYEKTSSKLSDKARDIIDNTILPEILLRSSSTNINWRLLGENDFGALEHLFGLTCNGFNRFDETQEMEFTLQVTAGKGMASNGDVLSFEMASP